MKFIGQTSSAAPVWMRGAGYMWGDGQGAFKARPHEGDVEMTEKADRTTDVPAQVEQAPHEAAPAPRVLSPEALRALAEAEERRQKAAAATEAAREINGRGGLDPVRYGDWEVKGLTSDF